MALTPWPSHAQPTAPESPDESTQWLHTIAPGDTLIGLRDTWLVPGTDWRLLQRLNRVAEPRRLQPGRTLRLPLALMREHPQQATVLHRHGQVLTQRGDQPPQPLPPTAQLSAGEWLITGPQSSVSLRLGDGSTVLLGPDSRLQVQRHLRLGLPQVLDTGLILQQGEAELRLPERTPPVRLRLQTPVINLGVRGTAFRARTDGERTWAEVEQGRVAMGLQSLQPGFGAIADRAGVGLARPLLSLPDLSTLAARSESLSLDLAFEPMAGAQAYRARIFDLEGQKLLRDGVFGTPLAAWVETLPDGVYELRVRGVDADGLEGREARAAFILKARPEPPLALAPAADAALVAERVRLEWTAQAEAARYRLQMAEEPGFAQPWLAREDLEGTVLDVTPPPGRWHWRLASVRADGDVGPWSPARAFTRSDPPPPPPAPALQTPRPTAQGRLLNWQASALPGARYEVQVSRDADFAQVWLQREVDSPEFLLELPAAGRHHMRVRTLDADGRAGAWGATQTLDVPRGLGWLWLLPLLWLL